MNLKKLVLLFLVIIPYILLIKSFLDFQEHYKYLEIRLDEVMENSYFLGCAEAGFPDLYECRLRALSKVIE
jgi:hypothetical protein